MGTIDFRLAEANARLSRLRAEADAERTARRARVHGPTVRERLGAVLIEAGLAIAGDCRDYEPLPHTN